MILSVLLYVWQQAWTGTNIYKFQIFYNSLMIQNIYT